MHILFYVHTYTHPHTYVLFFIGKHTVYRMSAATAEEKDEWTKCLK